MYEVQMHCGTLSLLTEYIPFLKIAVKVFKCQLFKFFLTGGCYGN